MKKQTKAVASNMWGSLLSTVAGVGIAALNLWANGTAPKQVMISSGVALLGALVKDPTK